MKYKFEGVIEYKVDVSGLHRIELDVSSDKIEITSKADYGSMIWYIERLEDEIKGSMNIEGEVELDINSVNESEKEIEKMLRKSRVHVELFGVRLETRIIDVKVWVKEMIA